VTLAPRATVTPETRLQAVLPSTLSLNARQFAVGFAALKLEYTASTVSCAALQLALPLPAIGCVRTSSTAARGPVLVTVTVS
jgi:hypothetical protein